VTNQEIADVFEACIPLIGGGTVSYICHAIYKHVHGQEWEAQWRRMREGSLRPHRCVAIVQETLAPTGEDALEWAVYEMFKERWDDDLSGLVAAKKQWRIDWLKSLVLEYRTKN
jgi:hypothetical protein